MNLQDNQTFITVFYACHINFWNSLKTQEQVSFLELAFCGAFSTMFDIAAGLQELNVFTDVSSWMVTSWMKGFLHIFCDAIKGFHCSSEHKSALLQYARQIEAICIVTMCLQFVYSLIVSYTVEPKVFTCNAMKANASMNL